MKPLNNKSHVDTNKLHISCDGNSILIFNKYFKLFPSFQYFILKKIPVCYLNANLVSLGYVTALVLELWY